MAFALAVGRGPADSTTSGNRSRLLNPVEPAIWLHRRIARSWDSKRRSAGKEREHLGGPRVFKPQEPTCVIG